MRALICSLALLGASAPADDAVDDLPSLVAAMEALQSPIKDFQCEFAGEDVLKGERAEAWPWKLGPDGLAETFGGVFVWQRDGDGRCDLFKRRPLDDFVQREITIVHWRDQTMDRSYAGNDGSIGSVDSGPLELGMVNIVTYYGELSRLNQFKSLVEKDAHETTVTDDAIDGRPMKLLTIWQKFKTIPNKLRARYWIDMARSGQVARVESYYNGPLASRWDIELKPFRVGEAEVWMPVAGEVRNYISGQAEVAKAPMADRASALLRALRITKEPTFLRSIRVVEGTMEFNRKPPQGMFSLAHRPAAPKSAPVGELFQRFGQKIPPDRPTGARAEATVEEQIAEAGRQGRLLVAVPREGIDWWPWSAGGLGLVLTGSLVALWIQRRLS